MGAYAVPANSEKTAFLQGSLDLLILRSLSAESRHGYGIAKHLREVSQEFLQVEEGSLYPALHRLERRGWIAARWGVSEANRRAKYYSLTAAGKKRLQAETAAWKKMREAIERVLSFRPAES
jgi:PadR family transcriptional regulator, regulatory protein PadR